MTTLMTFLVTIVFRVVDEVLQAFDRFMHPSGARWPENPLLFYARTICALEGSCPPHGEPQLRAHASKREHWHMFGYNIRIAKVNVGYTICIGMRYSRHFWTRRSAIKYLEAQFREWATEDLTRSGEHDQMISVINRAPHRIN